MRIPAAYSLLAAGLLASFAALAGEEEQDGDPHEVIVTTTIDKRALPSEKDALAFARKLEEAIRAGDRSFLAGALDTDHMASMVCLAIPIPEELRRSLAGSLGKNGTDVIQTLTGFSKGPDDYRFVRLCQQSGKMHALFRMTSPNGRLSYYDLALERVRGKIVISDVRSYAIGESAISILRRTIVPSMPKGIPGLSARERALKEHSEELAKIVQLQKQGAKQAALKAYYTLPPALRKDTLALLLAIRAAEGTERAELIKAFRTAHPRNPALDLKLLNESVNKSNHEAAIRCIERLEVHTGGDAALTYLRGAIKAAQEQPEKARELYNKAIEQDRNLVVAYKGLLMLSLRKREYSESVRLLEVIEGRGALDVKRLKTHAAFREFLKTQHGKKWQERQAKKTGVTPSALKGPG